MCTLREGDATTHGRWYSIIYYLSSAFLMFLGRFFLLLLVNFFARAAPLTQVLFFCPEVPHWHGTQIRLGLVFALPSFRRKMQWGTWILLFLDDGWWFYPHEEYLEKRLRRRNTDLCNVPYQGRNFSPCPKMMSCNLPTRLCQHLPQN